MHLAPAAFFRALVMGIPVMAYLTGMSCLFILHRFPESNRRIVTHNFNVVVNESTINMDDLLLPNSFHGSFGAIAHHTLGFLQVLPATPFTQEFADPIRKNIESRLKVIAAFVDIDMATAAHQNIEPLLQFFRGNFLKRDEADITVTREYLRGRQSWGTTLLLIRFH
jgi:hypothetical protein